MRFFSCSLLLFSPGLPALAAPNAPSALTASILSTSSVNLAWADNSNNEAGFAIGERVPPATVFTLLTRVAENRTSVRIGGLSEGTTYEYVVVAYDSGNANSPFSNIATVTTPFSILSPNYTAAYPQVPFSFNLISSNFAQVTGYSITALPDGLILNPATGLISGTPTGTSGKTTGTVTITYTGNRIATGPLTIRLFATPPALLPPAISGTAPGTRTLILGTTAAPISLTSLFTDPDVSSAARLTTDLGNLDFAFYPGSAPQTVANFLGYMSRGDFVNTIFHRSVPGFIIQAGAFRADATASAAPTQLPVVNESNLTNARGTIAMAKLGGNPDSATNQFFINLATNSANLDNQNEGFTVFARVAGNGMAIADAIASLKTGNYSGVNSALTDAPVRGTPPSSYDPTTLVRISQVAALAPLTLAAASSQPTVAAAALVGTDLTLTAVARGMATITLTASDLDNQSVTTTFQVTVKDAYDLWVENQSFLLPSDALPAADPDLDGSPNLLEYAFGTSPRSPDRPNLQFSLRGNPGSLQIRAFPPNPLPAGLIWNAEFSDTTGFSNSVVVPASSFPVSPPDNGAVYLEFNDPNPSFSLRRFGRLRVTRL